MCEDEVEVKDEELNLGPQRGPKSVAAVEAEVKLLRRLLDELSGLSSNVVRFQAF
jgi:hypothetical protein